MKQKALLLVSLVFVVLMVFSSVNFASSSKPVKLVYISCNFDFANGLERKQVADFMKANPNIQVELQQVSPNDILTTERTRYLGGEQLDLLFFTNPSSVKGS